MIEEPSPAGRTGSAPGPGAEPAGLPGAGSTLATDPGQAGAARPGGEGRRPGGPRLLAPRYAVRCGDRSRNRSAPRSSSRACSPVPGTVDVALGHIDWAVTVRSRSRPSAPVKVGVAPARRTASHRIARVDGRALTLRALALPVVGA